MRIYLAARYSRHGEMYNRASELLDRGYVVTSRWINGDHELRSGGQSDADEWMRRWAEEDLLDLLDADVVISFTEGPGEAVGRARGGRHVEFGIALLADKRLIVVGHRENVFHWLNRVEFYPTWHETLISL